MRRRRRVSGGPILSAVLAAPLTHRLKTLALVLVRCGRPDGSGIRPPLRWLAEEWGRSERRAQAALADLRTLGVLVVTRPRAPGRSTEYQFDVDRLASVRAPVRRRG